MFQDIAFWVSMTFGVLGVIVYMAGNNQRDRPQDAIVAALFFAAALCFK